MCDYSLHHVATRPAKVEDKLVSTKFGNSITRGFAEVGEPNVAVCLLPGTEIAFERNVECEPMLGILPTRKIGQSVARFRQINLTSRASTTMRWNSPTGRSCCSRACAKASARRSCNCPSLARPAGAAEPASAQTASEDTLVG